MLPAVAKVKVITASQLCWFALQLLQRRCRFWISRVACKVLAGGRMPTVCSPIKALTAWDTNHALSSAWFLTAFSPATFPRCEWARFIKSAAGLVDFMFLRNKHVGRSSEIQAAPLLSQKVSSVNCLKYVIMKPVHAGCSPCSADSVE